MKKALLVLIFLASTAHAEKPLDMFSTSNNFTDNTTIVWKTVDNIQEACNKESKRRGFGGFGRTQLEACSFWDKGITGNTCTIMTEKRVNYWTIGHEMRHCFQGNFH